MTKGADKIQAKSKLSSTRLALNFALIFVIVFLIQIPGCVVVCSSDAGQIDYFKHEKLIKFSDAMFAFPLRLLIDPANGSGSLLFAYFGNIALLSFVILFVLVAWRRISVKRNSL